MTLWDLLGFFKHMDGSVLTFKFSDNNISNIANTHSPFTLDTHLSQVGESMLLDDSLGMIFTAFNVHSPIVSVNISI